MTDLFFFNVKSSAPLHYGHKNYNYAVSLLNNWCYIAINMLQIEKS